MKSSKLFSSLPKSCFFLFLFLSMWGTGFSQSEKFEGNALFDYVGRNRNAEDVSAFHNYAANSLTYILDYNKAQDTLISIKVHRDTYYWCKPYSGVLPAGLQWNMTKGEVVAKFGKPVSDYEFGLKLITFYYDINKDMLLKFDAADKLEYVMVYYADNADIYAGYTPDRKKKITDPAAANYIKKGVTATSATTKEQTTEEWAKGIQERADADDKAAIRARQNAATDEFCTALQNAVKEYPAGFEKYKAEERHAAMQLVKQWYSNYMAEGSAYALVSGGEMTLSRRNSFRIALFDGPSSAMKMIALYQEYKEKINSCALSCCTFKSETKRSTEVFSTGQQTTWKVSALQPGANAYYKDMIIELSFGMESLGNEWFVNLDIYSVEPTY